MAFQKIGIMSIGEMGFHWAKLLKSHGVEVLTYDKDRGEVSRKRGENAGVTSVASMNSLVQEAELIVSIVVPSAAKKVAAKVAKAALKSGRKDLLYLRCQRDLADDRRRHRQSSRSRRGEFCRRLYHRFRGEDGQGHDRLSFPGRRLSSCAALEAFNIPIKILGSEHQSGIGVQSRLRRADQGAAGIILRVAHGRAEVWLAGRDSRSVRGEFSRFARQGFIEHRRLADSRRPARRGDGRIETHFQFTMVSIRSWRRRRRKFCARLPR